MAHAAPPITADPAVIAADLLERYPRVVAIRHAAQWRYADEDDPQVEAFTARVLAELAYPAPEHPAGPGFTYPP